jgi:hypothetical protein
MLNEVFARTVLAERARERELSLFLKSLHGSDDTPARRGSLRSFRGLPRLAGGAPVGAQPASTATVCTVSSVPR